MNVFSDVVITSGGVAAERKNVPDVLYFYARTYLPHISDTGYPVVTFKSMSPVLVQLYSFYLNFSKPSE